MRDRIFDINGKVALVTGASSGIGTHFCKVLADSGAKVLACARRKDRLDSLVAEIQAAGGEAAAIVMNVTSRTSINSAFDAAEAAFSTPDIICNNAGIAVQKSFVRMDEADWDSVVNTDLKAVFSVGQEAAQRLIVAGKPGSIINTASILGTGVLPELSAYSAAKAGVIQLTRSMALDLIRNKIRVNAICPGYFKTEMTEGFFSTPAGATYAQSLPSGRTGELEELSGALLLLASEASSYMSGSTITVDAAHSVRLS